jgi:hypothetical protein
VRKKERKKKRKREREREERTERARRSESKSERNGKANGRAMAAGSATKQGGNEKIDEKRKRTVVVVLVPEARTETAHLLAHELARL